MADNVQYFSGTEQANVLGAFFVRKSRPLLRYIKILFKSSCSPEGSLSEEREREREQLHAAARLCKMVAEASAGTSRMPQCLGSKLRDLAGLKTKDQAKWYRHKADRADIGQLVRNWPTMKSCSLYAFNSSPAFPESEQPRELPQSTKKRFQGLQD